MYVLYLQYVYFTISLSCIICTIQTVALSSIGEIDQEILKSMTSLGCFRDKSALLKALMSPE